ncbi:MAG: glycosyltransferase family 2 protein [Bacteroidales bacterium]
MQILFNTFEAEMSHIPTIYVALPVMDEADTLPSCLSCIENQTYQPFKVILCVNQPDEWWEIPGKKAICENNNQILELLSKKDKNVYTIINKSSKGFGWKGNKKGVGMARKTIMDYIAGIADNKDIILSLDADTSFNSEYFSSVIDALSTNKDAVALANPYYHKLTGSEPEDRSVLRYEIYMRNYAINLLIIGSPYSFTALGSAIALPVSSYKAIGGLSPKLSGEDFYFLQKLRKYGKIIIHNSEKVFPAARFSDRVFFGTGPAMIKGNKGDWDSYPIYHHSLFGKIKKTYLLFNTLFYHDCQTPMTEFLQEQFAAQDIWSPLMANFINTESFVRACHEKINGLRILQYCKSEQPLLHKTDEECLLENINDVFRSFVSYDISSIPEDFNECSINLLNEIRNCLVKIEETLQKKVKII